MKVSRITFRLDDDSVPVDATIYYDDFRCDKMPFQRCALSRRRFTEGGNESAVTIFCAHINDGRPIYVLPSEFAARTSPEAAVEELVWKWRGILTRRAALEEDARLFGVEVKLR